MFYVEINVAGRWDVWPYPYHEIDRATEDARKFMKYMTGVFQMRIIHDLDGAVVWSTARA